MFANSFFRGYSAELEAAGLLPKIKTSRISHGADLRSKKKARYPLGNAFLLLASN